MISTIKYNKEMIEIDCNICGTHVVSFGRTRKYCDNCNYKLKRKSDKKYCEANRQKLRNRIPSGGEKPCGFCGKGVKIWSYEKKLRVFCNNNCKYQFMAILMRGKNNPSWEGGKVNLTKTIRRGARYRCWKQEVFERDLYTCQLCNKRGCYLEAHHKKPFRDIIKENNITTVEEGDACQELWDTDNGITLCTPCHFLIDKNRRRFKKK